MTIAQRRAERAMYAAQARVAHGRWMHWHTTTNMSKRQFWHDRYATAEAKVKQLDELIARATHATRSSAACARMIAGFEGGQSADGRFYPYWDAAGGVWTIGYGHTEGVSSRSHSLSRPEATALLQRDLDRKYAPFVARLHLPLNQNQFDALTSAVYNLGPGVLGTNSTLGAALHRRDWHAAAKAFLLYDHAGGHALPGLTARRRAESRLFSTPV